MNAFLLLEGESGRGLGGEGGCFSGGAALPLLEVAVLFLPLLVYVGEVVFEGLPLLEIDEYFVGFLNLP
jgi:hypothetical protein